MPCWASPWRRSQNPRASLRRRFTTAFVWPAKTFRLRSEGGVPQGAGGLLGADIVAKARGDAHIVMMSSAASHGIGPVLYKDVPYDALADFLHIHLVGTFPTVLAVNGTSSITSVAQLIDQARAKPGEVTYGSGGNGTMNHLTGQLLARETGVPLTHIPYRGSAPAMNDLMGGQIVALMESLPTAIGYFTSGRMRPLAVSETERSPSLPDVPTFREAGFPGVVTTNWFGFSTPAGIPLARLGFVGVRPVVDFSRPAQL